MPSYTKHRLSSSQLALLKADASSLSMPAGLARQSALRRALSDLLSRAHVVHVLVERLPPTHKKKGAR